ncbi:HAD family hydrolase [Dubosiella newyorkensis]|uniref:HAD family hydrolase n=1 Tax=Dubosiella newyorkensis TaxID=1862672 RepID=UPI002573BB21|nr:HAD family phosphatase [Dubosiella newyorkensis]
MDKNWLSAFDTFIFDMDGLLVNSEDVYLLGWKRALMKFDLPFEERTLVSWNGKSALDCKRSILDMFQDPDLYEKLYAVREAFIYDSLENGDLHLLPYVQEVLVQLKKKNKKVVLATSCRRKRAMAILEKMGILAFFDGIITADDVENVKPFPDVYEKALESANASKKETLVLEDSSTGVIAAQNAGLEVVQVIAEDRIDARIGKIVKRDLSFLIMNEESEEKER